MPTQKLFVPGLRHDDEARVGEMLRAVPGVLFASASHHDECAEVEFDDDLLCPEDLRAAVAALGFEARLAG